MTGWTGRILEVDLSAGSCRVEQIPTEHLATYLGGRGLKILYSIKDVYAGTRWYHEPVLGFRGEENIVTNIVQTFRGHPAVLGWYLNDELPLPMGRRYQPGGIPLASEVGESLEFIGTREYREGDALRKIHWRSWARLGRPIVKEYQEEYFSRIALVLDTFLPGRARPHERQRLEAAISLLASVAGHFSRSEEVVDILAAGPDLYEVSTGRSLGYLDDVLDVLACLEPSPAPPFESIGPPLFARLERLTTVVAVMLEWDDAREAFLRRVRAMGVAVRVLLVQEGETRKPWASVSTDLGEVVLTTPAQVEARLAAEEGA